jgi:hypothetical protein
MPVPWLTVLKLVPWKDVARNAPAIADGAKKLWTKVGRKGTTGSVVNATTNPPPIPAGEPGLAALNVRLATQEARTAEMQESLKNSTALINELAEQNAQLVMRIESLHRRVLWLSVALIVLGALALRQFFA